MSKSKTRFDKPRLFNYIGRKYVSHEAYYTLNAEYKKVLNKLDEAGKRIHKLIME